MSRRTLVRTHMPASTPEDGEVEEIWSVLTHQTHDEWWSEVLDGHRHPYVHLDEHGFETVRKFFGDTMEESRQAALPALEKLVEERGGRVERVGETEEI